jgi:hypothetical protein
MTDYLLAHPEMFLVIGAVVICPLLSRLARLIPGPRGVAISKIFDGLGLDMGKVSRALRSPALPTPDEISRDVNKP